MLSAPTCTTCKQLQWRSKLQQSTFAEVQLLFRYFTRVLPFDTTLCFYSNGYQEAVLFYSIYFTARVTSHISQNVASQ